MRTETEKMLAGELYDPLAPELVLARNRASDLYQELIATREADQEIRRRIFAALFGKGGDSVWVQPPFYSDYGTNILDGHVVGISSEGSAHYLRCPNSRSSRMSPWAESPIILKVSTILPALASSSTCSSTKP